MKPRLLLTGATGTIGKAFIKAYQDKYEIYAFAHSEVRLRELLVECPGIHFTLGNIASKHSVKQAFEWCNPNHVVHLAAIKHVDFSELNPKVAVETNVVGSLNVIEACAESHVDSVVAVSTDKACNPCSTYGYTKALMEKCFVEAGHVVCRFGNVAGSAGSVIPMWLAAFDRKKPLKLTDPNMKRFMFTCQEAVAMIDKALVIAERRNGVIVTKLMPAVKLLDLAQFISTKVEIVGKGPGEQLGETLISLDEAPRTTAYSDYIMIGNRSEYPGSALATSWTTDNAPLMDDMDIEELLESCGYGYSPPKIHKEEGTTKSY